MRIEEAFEKFVKVKETKHGAEANCCLGLWGVSGHNKEDVLRQAWHCFVQYWSDGEYDHLINT